MLTKRLEALLTLIEPSSVLADVGCDHGKLACEAYKRSLAKLVYAMDVNELPLKQAFKTIEEYQLTGKVIPLLSDGFEKLPEAVETVIIAGMGFETCKAILEKDWQKTNRLKQIVIQVNRDVPLLRRWALEHHFRIKDECIIFEEHYYQMIVIEPNHPSNYSEIELDYGPILLQKNEKIMKDYLTFLQLKISNVLLKISMDHPKQHLLKEQLLVIEKLLKKS